MVGDPNRIIRAALDPVGDRVAHIQTSLALTVRTLMNGAFVDCYCDQMMAYFALLQYKKKVNEIFVWIMPIKTFEIK